MDKQLEDLIKAVKEELNKNKVSDEDLSKYGTIEDNLKKGYSVDELLSQGFIVEDFIGYYNFLAENKVKNIKEYREGLEHNYNLDLAGVNKVLGEVLNKVEKSIKVKPEEPKPKESAVDSARRIFREEMAKNKAKSEVNKDSNVGRTKEETETKSSKVIPISEKSIEDLQKEFIVFRDKVNSKRKTNDTQTKTEDTTSKGTQKEVGEEEYIKELRSKILKLISQNKDSIGEVYGFIIKLDNKLNTLGEGLVKGISQELEDLNKQLKDKVEYTSNENVEGNKVSRYELELFGNKVTVEIESNNKEEDKGR